MSSYDSLRRHLLFKTTLHSQNKDEYFFPTRLVLTLIIPSSLLFPAALYDGSLFLPGDDVGLMEHYGNLAFAILLPLVCLLGWRAFRLYDEYVYNISYRVDKQQFEEKYKYPFVQFINTNYFKEPYPLVKYSFMMIGLGLASWNMLALFSTDGTNTVWTHDVYDSWQHPSGFITQRLFFFLWWGYIVPVLVYRTIVLIIFLRRFFKTVLEAQALKIQILDPDKAGGHCKLGYMSLYLNFAVLASIPVPIALYLTHGFNTHLLCGVIIQIALLPIVFFMPLFSSHRAMKNAKDARLREICAPYEEISIQLQQKFSKLGGTLQEDETLKRWAAYRRMLRSQYDTLDRDMPTWPFDIKIVLKFATSLVSSVLAPIATFLLKNYLKG